MRLDEITRRGFLKGVASAISIAIGSVAVAPTPGHAASNWCHAATSKLSGWKIYIDLDSIEILEPGVYEFWFKIVDTNSKDKFPGIRNRPVRSRLNLNNRTVGEYVGNNISMEKIVPDSLGDVLRDIFLQWIKDKIPAVSPATR